MIKALARAFRWRKLLETGVFATVEEDQRLLCWSRPALTMLAPDIVEWTLDGCQPTDIELARLLRGFPVEWERQHQLFGPKRGD